MKQLIRGLILSCAALLTVAASANAHCDALDGPVVKAAQRALATGEVSYALVWVKPQNEQEIRDAFGRTLAVRKLGSNALELADRWFFETLVRVHRQGEGEPFTGLKPVGYYRDFAYTAADHALETGSFEPLSTMPQQISQRLQQLHAAAIAAKSYAPGDVESGRKYVQRYTEYVHFVESLAKLTRTAEHAHHGSAKH